LLKFAQPSCGRRRISRSRRDCFRQRELFAGQAGDETPAADFAARFQPVVDRQQLAPRGQPGRFAFQQAPEHHAVAAQQRHGDVFQRGRIGAWFARRRRFGGGLRRLGVSIDGDERGFHHALGDGDAVGAPHQRPAAGFLHGRAGAPAAALVGAGALIGRHQHRAQAGVAVGVDQASRHQLA
jgi:hypothetical protein